MSSKQPPVQLIVPGLLNLPLHELDAGALADATPNLHRLLRFASAVENRLMDFDQVLVDLLQLEQGGVAYARAINPQLNAEQILFKPVHLKSDINNAIVFPVENESDQINLIINELKDYFKVDCTVEKHPDNLWLMSLKEVKALTGMPHHLSAMGKKVTHYLEQARENLQWFKLFNEIQMFLYQHPVNQQRQQSGLPLINSLWCWGGDAFQGESRSELEWFSDDFLMQSVGQLYTGSARNLDELSSRNENLQTIVVELSLLKALKGDASVDLLQTLQALENNCLVPLMSEKKISVEVKTSAAINLNFKSSDNWKFWKPAKSLSDFNPV